MRKLLFLTLTLALMTTAANAACIRCDQWTGYTCFMSIYGTKAHCDSPTNAGCFMWGSCSSSGECDDDRCIQNPVALRYSNQMRFASMSIIVSFDRKA